MDSTTATQSFRDGLITTNSRKKGNRAGNGVGRRKCNATAKHRQRQIPIDQCHLKSRKGLQVPFPEFDNPVTVKYYLGEHQSQVFYGGFEVLAPRIGPVHVEIGQAIPIDLRKNFEADYAVPSLAVPLHIFRRFHELTNVPAVTVDASILAVDSSVNGDVNGNIEKASHQYQSNAKPANNEKNSDSTTDPSTIQSDSFLVSFCAYCPVTCMESADNSFNGSSKCHRVLYPPVSPVIISNCVRLCLREGQRGSDTSDGREVGRKRRAD